MAIGGGRNEPGGKRARAISQRSGMSFPYNEMVREPGTGWLVHKSESDGAWNLRDHPRNFVGRDARRGENLGVEWARIDRDEPFSFPVIWLGTSTGDFKNDGTTKKYLVAPPAQKNCFVVHTSTPYWRS